MAGSIEASPVSIEFQPGQRARAVTVANRGDEKATVQIRTFAWSQVDGVDRLDGTRDLQPSPPIFEIAVGASQVVRLVLRQPPTGEERAFRLIVDELPDRGTAPGGGVRLAVRLSIPVFAQPAGGLRQALTWRVERANEQAVDVVVRNTGTRRARIADLRVALLPGRELVGQAGLSGYILVGSERRWALSAPAETLADTTELQITAATEEGPTSVSVSLPSIVH